MAAGALLEQSRQESLDGVDGAPQIDVDHPAPVVVRHLRDRTSDHDAGVAEHHIDLAEKTKRLVGQVRHLLEKPNIAHHTVRLKSLRLQMRDSLLERRLVDVGENETCSAPCQLGCGGETDTVRAAGDDGALPLESTHGATVADAFARLKSTPASSYFRQLPPSTGSVTPVT